MPKPLQEMDGQYDALVKGATQTMTKILHHILLPLVLYSKYSLHLFL